MGFGTVLGFTVGAYTVGFNVADFRAGSFFAAGLFAGCNSARLQPTVNLASPRIIASGSSNTTGRLAMSAKDTLFSVVTTTVSDYQSSTLISSTPTRSLSWRRLPTLPRRTAIWVHIRRWNRRLFHRSLTLALIAATFTSTALLMSANQRPKRTLPSDEMQLTLETLIVAISIVVHLTIVLAVAGAFNQYLWN